MYMGFGWLTINDFKIFCSMCHLFLPEILIFSLMNIPYFYLLGHLYVSLLLLLLLLFVFHWNLELAVSLYYVL